MHALQFCRIPNPGLDPPPRLPAGGLGQGTLGAGHRSLGHGSAKFPPILFPPLAFRRFDRPWFAQSQECIRGGKKSNRWHKEWFTTKPCPCSSNLQLCFRLCTGSKVCAQMLPCMLATKPKASRIQVQCERSSLPRLQNSS